MVPCSLQYTSDYESLLTVTNGAMNCGSLGGISRIDMHFYAYRYISPQLTDIAKQVMCVSIVRSSVDPKTLSDATLRNIVQSTYSSSTLDEQTQMYDQLAQARGEKLNCHVLTSPICCQKPSKHHPCAGMVHSGFSYESGYRRRCRKFIKTTSFLRSEEPNL